MATVTNYNAKRGKGKAAKLNFLFDNIGKDNIAGDIDTEMVHKIGEQVANGYETDLISRQDWQKKTEDGLKIAKQITEKKTFPWPGAANVKYPMIATAAIQFAARSYPQIINGADIVKAKVVGEDPDGAKEARAKRVGQYMSYQLLEQMPEWEPDMDQLLHGLPVMGTYFKKTFFDPVLQRSRSICLTPLEVVVHNKHKGTLDTCRRISQELYLYKNEVIERENVGVYTEGTADAIDWDEDTKEQELFIEQHCWYDLDEDGYEEPYIVTIHKRSHTVARIVANYDQYSMNVSQDKKLISIKPIPYFTKYTFIPSPDGEFYDIGFAHLLGPINETMSTIINQLLDAGALATCGGGFISRGIRSQTGAIQFRLGEWKPVDVVGGTLKDGIVPLPIREPSNVLFQLLGMLNDAGNKLAAVSDMMSGETPSQNTPATTVLALIEQGLKVFTSIYKRVFRAMKEEFKLLYRLNGVYMEDTEYIRVLDSSMAVFKKDFATEDLAIVPLADPSMSSEAQKLARAQALLQTMGANPDPMGRIEILRQYYDAIGAKNINVLINMDQIKQQMQQPPPPDPNVLKVALETQKAKDAASLEQDKQHHESVKLIKHIELQDAQIAEIKARTMKILADTEIATGGQQLAMYKHAEEALANDRQHEQHINGLVFEHINAAVDREHEKDMMAKQAAAKAQTDSGGSPSEAQPAPTEQPANPSPGEQAPAAPIPPSGGSPVSPEEAAAMMPAGQPPVPASEQGPGASRADLAAEVMSGES